MHYNIFIILFSMLFTILIGCNDVRDYNKDIENNNKTSKGKKESLVKVNKYLVNTENTEIENYIKRHKLDVTNTGSGLKYQIIKHGTGDTATLGKIITLKYKVKLITGDIIYSSNEDGPLTFEIGHGGVESGLEEAILNMRVGDEAIIIIPSHLGHGLLGDNKKIPQRSTIIYEIEITNIN
jgi:FKBP-type peptidyl-prolyl cis-trans isomerase FkpA